MHYYNFHSAKTLVLAPCLSNQSSSRLDFTMYLNGCRKKALSRQIIDGLKKKNKNMPKYMARHILDKDPEQEHYYTLPLNTQILKMYLISSL